MIPEGGVAPNVVPDRAVVDYYIRYPDEVYLAHIDSMMSNAARAAALATGTKVTIDRYGEYRDGITLGSLEELVYAYAEKLRQAGVNVLNGALKGFSAQEFKQLNELLGRMVDNVK